MIRALTVKSDVWTNCCANFDVTVKALMISNSLHHRNFQMKTDMDVKYTKLYTHKKILASKMQNVKQQKTSVFAPLILKMWINFLIQPVRELVSPSMSQTVPVLRFAECVFVSPHAPFKKYTPTQKMDW